MAGAHFQWPVTCATLLEGAYAANPVPVVAVSPQYSDTTCSDVVVVWANRAALKLGARPSTNAHGSTFLGHELARELAHILELQIRQPEALRPTWPQTLVGASGCAVVAAPCLLKRTVSGDQTEPRGCFPACFGRGSRRSGTSHTAGPQQELQLALLLHVDLSPAQPPAGVSPVRTGPGSANPASAFGAARQLLLLGPQQPHTAADAAPRGALLAQTLLDVLFLRSLPVIVSVLTVEDGAVVYQNEASHLFYGDRLKGGSAPPPPPPQQQQQLQQPHASSVNLLPQLFACDPQKLEQLLTATVENAGMWEGLVRVPLTLYNGASATSPWPSAAMNPLPYNAAVACPTTGGRAASSSGVAAAAKASPGAAVANMAGDDDGSGWRSDTAVVCCVGDSQLPMSPGSNSGDAASITAAAPAAVSPDELSNAAHVGVDTSKVPTAGHADAAGGPQAASSRSPPPPLLLHRSSLSQLHPQPQSGLRPIQEHDLSSSSQDVPGLSAAVAAPHDISAAFNLQSAGARGFGAGTEHDYVLLEEVEEKPADGNGDPHQRPQANGSILTLSMSRRADPLGGVASSLQPRSGSNSLRGESRKPSEAQIYLPVAEPTAAAVASHAKGVMPSNLPAASLLPAIAGLSGYTRATASAGAPTLAVAAAATAAAASASASASAGGAVNVAMAMGSNGSWSSSVTAMAASAADATRRRMRLHEGSSCGSVDDSVAAAMVALTASSNIAPPSVGPNSSARGWQINSAAPGLSAASGGATAARANTASTASSDPHAADASRHTRRNSSTLRRGGAAVVPAGTRVGGGVCGGDVGSPTAVPGGAPTAAATAEDDSGSAGESRVERTLRVLLRRNSDTRKLSAATPPPAAKATSASKAFRVAAMATVDLIPFHGRGSRRARRATLDAVIAGEHVPRDEDACFADDSIGSNPKKRTSRRRASVGVASASFARRLTSSIARFVTTAVGGSGSKTGEVPTVDSTSSRHRQPHGRSGSVTPMTLEAADVERASSSSSSRRAGALTGGGRASGMEVAAAARGRAAFTSPVAVGELRSQQADGAAKFQQDEELLYAGADWETVLRAYRSYSVDNMARPKVLAVEGVGEEPLPGVGRQGMLLHNLMAGRASHQQSFSAGVPPAGAAGGSSGSRRSGATFGGMTGAGAAGSGSLAAAVAAASGLTRQQSSRVGGSSGSNRPARSARPSLFKSVDPLATSSWQVLYDASSVRSSVDPSSMSQANGSNNAESAKQQARQPLPTATEKPLMPPTQSHHDSAVANAAINSGARVITPPRALHRSPSQQQLLQVAAHSPAVGAVRRHSALDLLARDGTDLSLTSAAQDSGGRSVDSAFKPTGAASTAGAPSSGSMVTGMAAVVAGARPTRARTQPSLKRAQTAGWLSMPGEEEEPEEEDDEDDEAAAGVARSCVAARDALMADPGGSTAAQHARDFIGLSPAAAAVAAGALAARGSTGARRGAGHALAFQQARGSADPPRGGRARGMTSLLNPAAVAAMYGSSQGGGALQYTHHCGGDDGDPLGVGTSCGMAARLSQPAGLNALSPGFNSLLGIGSATNRPASRVLQFASTLSRYPAASSLLLISPHSNHAPAHLGSAGAALHSPAARSPVSSQQHAQFAYTGMWPPPRVPSLMSQSQSHLLQPTPTPAAGSAGTAAGPTPAPAVLPGSSGGGSEHPRPQPPAAAVLAERRSNFEQALRMPAGAAAGTAAAAAAESGSWEDVAAAAVHAAATYRCSVVPEDYVERRAHPTMAIRSEVKAHDADTRVNDSTDPSNDETAGAGGGVESLRRNSSNELLNRLLQPSPPAAAAATVAAPTASSGSRSVTEQQARGGVMQTAGGTAPTQPAGAASSLLSPALGRSRAPTAAAAAAAHASSGRGGGASLRGQGGSTASQQASATDPWIPGAGPSQQKEALAWHEVRAVCVEEPTTGERLLIVMQKDVTAKVEAERHIAQVSEAEHRLLEQIFPRHVLAYMMEEAYDPTAHMTQQQLQLDMEELHSAALEQPLLLDPHTHGGTQAARVGDAEQQEAPEGTGKLPAAPRAARGRDPDGSHAERARRDSTLALTAWRPHVRDCTRLATWHDRVTVLFADIQGFTPMCKVLPPTVVMRFLNDLFVRFDAQLDVHGVYKVETIGDCYVVAGGLMHEDAEGFAAVKGDGVDASQADKVFAFARAMLRSASRVTLPTTGEPVKIRVGIHSGPVVSGVVGTRMPRFCLFGDTINTASRMESTGTPGCIHVSSDMYALLSPNSMAGGGSAGGSSGWAASGGVEVKGKGMMDTFLWTPPRT